MADPAPGQTPTPATPTSPFEGGGAAGNIDQQKALLNDIIAMGGNTAAQLYGEQDQRTQAALQSRMAEAPTTTAQKGIYDAFSRDAQEARRQHAESQQRQAQLGNIFMDQAKGAVPMYEAQQKSLNDSLRMQYEASARRDAEQAQAQKEATARSYRSSGGGGGGRSSSSSSAPKTGSIDDIKGMIASGELSPTLLTSKEAKMLGRITPPLSLSDTLMRMGTPLMLKKYQKPLDTAMGVVANMAKDDKMDFDSIDAPLMEFLQRQQDAGLIDKSFDLDFIATAAKLANGGLWGIDQYDWKPGDFRGMNRLKDVKKEGSRLIPKISISDLAKRR